MRISRQHPHQILTEQKKLENVEYFNYLGSVTQAMQDVQWNQTQDCHEKGGIQQENSFGQQIGLTFENKTEGILHLERKLYGAET